MALSVSSTEVRAQLAADFVTAWDAQKVLFSQALTPLSENEFAGVADSRTAIRAYALLPLTEPEVNTFGTSVVRMLFRLIGVFRFPPGGNGDVLQDVKETNADTLIAVLTAQTRYVGGARRVLAVRYNDVPATEQLQGHFEVEIDFEWRGSSGR